MNKQKKKCEHLKQIRKNVADAIGVELNQSVCTFEGECKGTCPKCEQEERKLSILRAKRLCAISIFCKRFVSASLL